jgi:hypothetical protein
VFFLLLDAVTSDTWSSSIVDDTYLRACSATEFDAINWDIFGYVKTAACRTRSFNWTWTLMPLCQWVRTTIIKFAVFVTQLLPSHSFACILFFFICLCLKGPRNPGLQPKSQQQNGTWRRLRHSYLFFETSRFGMEAPVLRRVPLLLQQLVLNIFILKVPSRQLHIVERSGQV